MQDLNPLNNINFPSLVQTLGSNGVSSWFEEKVQSVQNATPESMAWLYAQGWEDNGLLYDTYGNASGHVKRTQIKPQQVLSDLYKDYRNAYEEGREVNERRYRDIVYLYVNIFNDSETDMIALQTDDTTFDATIDTLLSTFTTDYTDAETDMENSLDQYGTSQRTAIETRFAAKKADIMAGLVSRGMYNTSSWTVISAGIDREEAVALAAVNDSIYEKQLALKDRLYTFKTNLRDRLLNAYRQVRSELHESKMARATLRNRIMEALNSFMERRVDSYPDATAFGNIATQIGLGAPKSFEP